MIYTLHGITERQLLAMIQKGQLPGVTLGRPNEHYDPPVPTIGVDIAQSLEEGNPAVQAEIAGQISELFGQTIPPKAIRPYIKTLAEAVLVGGNEAAQYNSSQLDINEAHNYAKGLLDTLVAALTQAGAQVGWEVDLQATNMVAEAEHHDCDCVLCSGAVGPEEWPVEGHTRACTCRLCVELRTIFVHMDELARAEEIGWTGHVVAGGDPSTPTGFNAHTHVNPKRINHRDLQIILPIQPSFANYILTTLMNRIKAGASYKAGDVAEAVWEAGGKPYHVTFIEAIECDRPVLRVIVPTEAGELTLEDMKKAGADDEFLMQYDTTNYRGT